MKKFLSLTQAMSLGIVLNSEGDPSIPIDSFNNGVYNGPDWGLMVPKTPEII